MNESIIAELNIALKDLVFERRMFMKDQREFIKNSLVQKDLEIFKNVLKLNDEAFGNKDDIVVSFKDVDGRFVSRIVNSESSEYEAEYRKQLEFLNRMINACDEIMKYLDEQLEKETADIMHELYGDLGIEEPTEKEEVETLTIDDDPESEAELERIMNEIHEKARLYKDVDEAEVDRLMKEVNDKVNPSSSKENALNLINELIEKGNVLKTKIDDKPTISKVVEWRAFRIKDNIDAISRYYDKFESKNGFKTVDDFDEGVNYIQSDLENDITYLHNKISEIEGLYSESKPIVIPIDGDVKIFVPGDSDYETAYKYICTEMKLAVAKGEVLLSKYFHKKEADKPDINYAMEMMFNEVKDTFDEINKSIEQKDANFNMSMQVLWIDASVKILNNLKSDLENDYKNGNPIRLTSLNKDGVYEVTTVENTKENYEEQLNYLNKIIDDCENLKERLESVKKVSEEDSEKHLVSDIDKKYVIIEKDGEVIILGMDITKDDIKKMNSPILEEAKKNKTKVTLSKCVDAGLYNVKGILVEIHEDGTIGIGGEVERIEFHNQMEKYRKTSEDKTQSISDVVDELLTCYKNGNISEIMKLFKNNNPSLIWEEIGVRIQNGKFSPQEFWNFRDYLVDNYDDREIISDNVFLNDKYKELSKRYNKEEMDEDYTDESKDVSIDKAEAALLPARARRVKKRTEKKSLIQRFKELKTWKKVAIVAGLSIAGIAIIGTGVYHLVPGVKPMIDGFIQGFNPSHVNDMTNGQANAVNHVQNVIDQVKDVVSQSHVVHNVASSAPSVDFSSLGEGHTVFRDAFSAVTGNNPQIANSWFVNNPLDVFNTQTNQFMHLTSEQLHDAEFLKTLAGDPNNAMLFGNNMSEPSGFVSLADIAGEIIKGGKVL